MQGRNAQVICQRPACLTLRRTLTNRLEPFEVDGVEWIDGSVQADLPFQRISTLFAVSSFIVSQVRCFAQTELSLVERWWCLKRFDLSLEKTNFHIVPLLLKAHHPNRKSMYWQIFQTIEWDIRSRALKLSRLGYVGGVVLQFLVVLNLKSLISDYFLSSSDRTCQKCLSNATTGILQSFLNSRPCKPLDSRPCLIRRLRTWKDT
jgi:predicted acylesterase/phospholipase RssA